MLALAWATLPDLERERKGVLLVGVGMCSPTQSCYDLVLNAI